MNFKNINTLLLALILNIAFSSIVFSQSSNESIEKPASDKYKCKVDVDMLDTSDQFIKNRKIKRIIDKQKNSFTRSGRKKNNNNTNVANSCVVDSFKPCENSCKNVTVDCEDPPPSPTLTPTPTTTPKQSPTPTSTPKVSPTPTATPTSTPTSTPTMSPTQTPISTHYLIPIPTSAPKHNETYAASSINRTAKNNFIPDEITRSLSMRSQNFPCPGSICITQGTGGNCILHMGQGVIDSYRNLGGESLQCGSILSVEQWSAFFNNYRNSLLPMIKTIINLPEVKSLSQVDKEALAVNIYQALLLSCQLADESLHIKDQHYCKHERACTEATSGKSNLDCYNDPLITQGVLKLLGKLAPKLSNDLNKSYCFGLFHVQKSFAIERCICDQTRAPRYTKKKCLSCIDRNTVPSKFNSSYCKGVLSEKEQSEVLNYLKTSYRDPNIASHSCEAYQLSHCVKKYCELESPDLQACFTKHEDLILKCAE